MNTKENPVSAKNAVSSNTATTEEKRSFIEIISDPQNMVFTLILIAFSLYYIWRMFYLSPSYRELHDYYYFISRSPFHVMTHWSSEGNHVGYNFISSFLNLTGNSMISLRGFSCIAAISNLILLYRIMRRLSDTWLPIVAVIFYLGFYQVNNCSVLGRGYCFSTFYFLLCFYMLTRLNVTYSFDRKQYIIFTSIIACALYVLPWNVCWVIPTTAAVVFYLFLNGFRTRKVSGKWYNNNYYSQLFSILLCAMIAFAIDGFLYLILIVSIGTQSILGKDVGFIKTIVTFPQKPGRILTVGTDLFLQPFGAQKIEGDTYSKRWVSFVYGLSNDFAKGLGWILIGFGAIALIFLFLECVRHFEESRTIIRLILIFVQLWMPFELIFTNNIPENSTFMYMGVCMAMSIVVVIKNIVVICQALKAKIIKSFFAKKNKKADSEKDYIIPEKYLKASFWIPILAAIYFFFRLVFGQIFYIPYENDTDELYQAFVMVRSNKFNKVYVLDDTQRYMIDFMYGKIPCSDTIQDCDFVLLKQGMDESKALISGLHVTYENNSYILLTK